MPEINKENIPSSVGIIMDGNGRWAKNRGLARVKGHNEGMKALREIVKHSHVLGIKYLTVYAFSTENWKRPLEEVSGIFKLLVLYVQSELDELNKNNVKVNIIGDINPLPADAKDMVALALETTKNNTGLIFNIALNYGGRAEIIRACNLAIQNGKKIDENDFSNLLYTAGIPDPDLIIRTGGESRLSNFLTWQSAYSEIVICDVLWPDFTPAVLDDCIIEYQKRDRRFGGVKI